MVSTRLSTCYRHPDRETGVRCQRCERPLCAECMVPAPVGFQCVDCVRAARSRVIPVRSLLRGSQPFVTYVLIGTNVAVWGVGVVLSLLAGGYGGIISGGSLAGIGGLSASAVEAGQWWRIFTAAFLHSGLIHLSLNMAALFVFGAPLERALGRLRFVALYAASLVSGSLGALLLSPGALTVGASGAIFGLLGAIVVAQRAAGISLRSGGVLTLLIINLVFTLAVPGISIGGHLGGLAGGLIAGSLLFRQPAYRGSSLASAAACLALAGAGFVGSVLIAGHPLVH